MTPVLALTLGGPLMLLFGIMVAAVLGAAGGFVVGSTMGRTKPETPLPTTVRLTRDQLAAACADLEKASKKLGSSHKSEESGSALVISRRISELSARLGRLGRQAQHRQEESA